MRVKRNVWDIAGHVLCLGLLLFTTVFLAMGWKNLPQELPTHFNLAGQADGWGDKSTLLALPVIAWVLYVTISILEHFPQIWNVPTGVTEENSYRIYRIVKSMLVTLKLITTANFCFLSVQSVWGENLPVWYTPVFLGLLFGVLVIYLVRAYRAR